MIGATLSSHIQLTVDQKLLIVIAYVSVFSISTSISRQLFFASPTPSTYRSEEYLRGSVAQSGGGSAATKSSMARHRPSANQTSHPSFEILT
ncbi:hypothetical protein RB195_015958 [Necator americanus]|uniref:Uncharacterized protein n=1 Tax=Necator americanus TaxID=51031 RepID=A0ABR1E6W8_NECAM